MQTGSGFVYICFISKISLAMRQMPIMPSYLVSRHKEKFGSFESPPHYARCLVVSVFFAFGKYLVDSHTLKKLVSTRERY